MPVISIRHLTTYRYRKPVAFGEHRMMFRPLQAFDQRLISAQVTVSPEPELLRHIQDVSGACVGVARFDRPADRLVFDSRARVEHTVHTSFDLEASGARLGIDALYDADEHPELATSLRRAYGGAGEVEQWARRFLPANAATPVSTVLTDMTHAIRSEFAYALRLRGAPQSPAETLSLRSGSCRDFAVLMMDAARSLGIAARFVSGYVYSASAKSGPPGSGRTGGGHTHAWMRAYVPGCGWMDFDPTNGIVGNLDLIRVAVVADPRLALPLHGSWDGEAGDYLGMDVEVDLSVEDAQAAQPPFPLRVAQAG
jgi:transglutaminase-like putative cysteine protease